VRPPGPPPIMIMS